MKANEILRQINSVYDDDIEEVLRQFLANGIDDDWLIAESLVTLASAHDEAPIRDLAKEVIETGGTAAMRKALEIAGDRDFCEEDDQRLLLAIVDETSAIEGFSDAEFARLLLARLGWDITRVRQVALEDYYWQNVTLEELDKRWRIDEWDEDIEGYRLTAKLNDERADAFWKLVEELRDDVIDIRFAGNRLPEQFGEFPRLLRFFLENATVTELPSLEGIPELDTLQLIALPNLESLPSSLGSRSRLRILRIEACPELRALPDFIGELPALQKLTLDDSAIEELGEAIGRSQSLRQIILVGTNPIKSIHPSVLEIPTLSEAYREELEQVIATL